MALSLIAYPKVIYVQATEPAKKTAGLLWHDTDDSKLYSADGTNYNLIGEVPGAVILGSGSWTSAGDGSVQSAGNFLSSGDLGNGEIVVLVNVHRPGATGQCQVAIDAVANNFASPWEVIAATHCFLRYEIVKNPATATNVNAIKIYNGSVSNISNNTEFNLSGDRIIYINLRETVAGVFNVNWLAYKMKA